MHKHPISKSAWQNKDLFDYPNAREICLQSDMDIANLSSREMVFIRNFVIEKLESFAGKEISLLLGQHSKQCGELQNITKCGSNSTLGISNKNIDICLLWKPLGTEKNGKRLSCSDVQVTTIVCKKQITSKAELSYEPPAKYSGKDHSNVVLPKLERLVLYPSTDDLRWQCIGNRAVVAAVSAGIGFCFTFLVIVSCYYAIRHEKRKGTFQGFRGKILGLGQLVIDFFVALYSCICAPCRECREEYRGRIQNPIRNPIRKTPKLPKRDYPTSHSFEQQQYYQSSYY